MRCVPLFHESGTQRFFVLSENPVANSFGLSYFCKKSSFS